MLFEVRIEAFKCTNLVNPLPEIRTRVICVTSSTTYMYEGGVESLER